MTGHCANCKFWQKNTDAWGECRRQAPQPCVTLERHAQPSTLWPATGPGDWCGEYSAEESRRGAVVPLPRPAPEASATA